MLRIIFLFSFLVQSIFAIDATMEIIKKKSSLPTVSVSVSNESSLNDSLGIKVAKLVEKDLKVSGHFNTSDIKLEMDYDETPNYKILKDNGIDLNLVLKVEKSNLSGIIAYIKLYDVNSETITYSKSYTVSNSIRYPFLSHNISIDINKHLKAPSIEWMNRLVIFSRYLNSKNSEIVISDYTLTYQKTVVKGGLNIFPKWANELQEEFYYTTYRFENPTLIKQNLYTKKKEIIVSSDGMVVCSDVSSDGRKLALTMAPKGQPDIYVYDTVDKIKTRVTKFSGIDVGGSFVENDTKIVFVSDRLKYPNIFAKKLGSNGIERMIYHGKNNSQCSTYKDYIVYSSRETDNEFGGNAFNLYLISTNSDYVRRLTTVGRNQFPKFSRDGETVLFIKNVGKDDFLGIVRINYNKSFRFKLKSGKLQSIDW